MVARLVNKLKQQRRLWRGGAQLGAARLVGRPFQNTATLADVAAAYRLILGRNPDPAGFAHYSQLVADGAPLDRIFHDFLNSQEYAQRAAADDALQTVDCGGYFVCVKQSEHDFGAAILEDKTWEPHVVAILTDLLQPGHTFLDIGANVGVMTFLGARAVGPTGRVIAVEANPDNQQLLYAGILANGTTNVQVIPLAASDKAAVFALTGGSSNTYLAAPEGSRQLVQSVRLDDILAGLTRLDVVKIDIEGHEPFALRGSADLLRRHRPLVLMEFNPRCLRNFAGVTPLAFLDEVFAHFSDVRVVEHSGKVTAFADAAALWAYWEHQNEAAVRQGVLTDGLLHFELLARAV